MAVQVALQHFCALMESKFLFLQEDDSSNSSRHFGDSSEIRAFGEGKKDEVLDQLNAEGMIPFGVRILVNEIDAKMNAKIEEYVRLNEARRREEETNSSKLIGLLCAGYRVGVETQKRMHSFNTLRQMMMEKPELLREILETEKRNAVDKFDSRPVTRGPEEFQQEKRRKLEMELDRSRDELWRELKAACPPFKEHQDSEQGPSRSKQGPARAVPQAPVDLIDLTFEDDDEDDIKDEQRSIKTSGGGVGLGCQEISTLQEPHRQIDPPSAPSAPAEGSSKRAVDERNNDDDDRLFEQGQSGTVNMSPPKMEEPINLSSADNPAPSSSGSPVDAATGARREGLDEEIIDLSLSSGDEDEEEEYVPSEPTTNFPTSTTTTVGNIGGGTHKDRDQVYEDPKMPLSPPVEVQGGADDMPALEPENSAPLPSSGATGSERGPAVAAVSTLSSSSSTTGGDLYKVGGNNRKNKQIRFVLYMGGNYQQRRLMSSSSGNVVDDNGPAQKKRRYQRGSSLIIPPHIQVIPGPPQEMYKCTKCTITEEKAPSKYKWLYVTNHRYCDKKEEEWPFQCDNCQRKFQSKYRLYCHTRYHHGPRKFVCEFCGKRFAHRCHLNDHLKWRNQCSLSLQQRENI